MKKTGLKNKLSLIRETLVSLSPDALANVAGGNIVSIPTTGTGGTRALCPPSRSITGCQPPTTITFCTGNSQGDK